MIVARTKVGDTVKPRIRTRSDQTNVGRLIVGRLIELDGVVDWAEIKRLVSETYEVHNWLLVRGAVQELLDRGVLNRTDDLSIERFIAPGMKRRAA